jgi:hypothetical protein
MANIPDEFPTFSKLSLRQLTVLCAKFKYYLKDFETNSGLFGIYPDPDVLIEICDRVEKRRVYFHIYYDKCKMGELNEGVSYVFLDY